MFISSCLLFLSYPFSFVSSESFDRISQYDTPALNFPLSLLLGLSKPRDLISQSICPVKEAYAALLGMKYVIGFYLHV